MRFLIVCCICLSTVITSLGQEGRKVIRGFNFQTENDVFAGMVGFKNKDKDYSGGFRFEFYTDYLRQGIFPLFRNREESPRLDRPLQYNINSLYLHGMGFTPDRSAFALLTPDLTQRPYSSIFGVGWKRVALFDKKEDTISTGLRPKRPLSIVSDLFVGKVGLDIPGDFQNFLHEYVTDSDMVMGWENQIGNGGRWVFKYNVLAHITAAELKHFIFKRPSYIYVSPQATIGNLFVNGGAKLSLSNQQVGTISTVSAMPSSFLTEDFKNLKKNHFRYELYVRALYIQYNTLLQGMPFYDNSVYKIPASKINRGLYDIGAKILFLYSPDRHKIRNNFAFFEMIYRTKEFSYGENHVFGNIGFTIMVN